MNTLPDKTCDDKVMVVAITPNGDVQRITNRRELAWARAEGLKPFMLGSPAAIAAAKARAAILKAGGEA